jgi:hypothetical protein
MTLAIATIRTNAYTDIYNHLQTGTYAITTNNIHPSYNRLQRIQEGYPQVIILEPIVSMEKITFGDNGLWEVPITVNIDVYEDSAADAKTVADEVTNKILTGRRVLRTAGFKNIKFLPDEPRAEPYSQVKTLHFYTIVFTAVYRGAS